MENRNLTISYVSCQLDELEAADRELVEAAAKRLTRVMRRIRILVWGLQCV